MGWDRFKSWDSPWPEPGEGDSLSQGMGAAAGSARASGDGSWCPGWGLRPLNSEVGSKQTAELT